jgi:putative lipoprotein (rSAM/lipoprotein system)
MKNIHLKSFDKIIVLILGCIGYLTGCNLINPPMAEYGTPHADYEIKGAVTDSITASPIQNARIIITQDHSYTNGSQTLTYIDTMAVKRTDSEGKYDVQVVSFPLEEVAFKVKVDDTDGSANGGDFIKKESDVLFKSSELTGGKGGWYDGKAVKTVDFKLKKK